MALSDGLDLLSGDNGQGKTNWLEAIAILASTRSFRTSRLPETVRFGESLAIVKGRGRESPEITRELQVAIEGNTKMISINGKKEPASRYLGQLSAVVFNADSLDVVRGLLAP